ncbi:MAG: zinc ribbon domain-containing protein [Actinomycetota bacterium]
MRLPLRRRNDRVERRCPACDRPTSPTATFCGHCGTELDVEHPPVPDHLDPSPRLLRLIGLAEAMAWAVAGLSVTMLWFGVTQRRLVGDLVAFRSIRTTIERLDRAEATWSSGLVVLGIGGLIAVITAAAALHRIDAIVRRHGATGLRLPSGFAIGAWFVPLGNAVLVGMVLDDLDRALRAPSVPLGQVGARRARATPWIGAGGAVLAVLGASFAWRDLQDPLSVRWVEAGANGRVGLALGLVVAYVALATVLHGLRAGLTRLSSG